MLLNSNALHAFDRDGYLTQENVLSDESVQHFLTKLTTFAQHVFPGHVREKNSTNYRAFHGCHLYDEDFAALIRSPQLLGPAKQLLKSDVYLHQLKVNLKQPFSGELWPWHQDYIYWRNEDQVPTDAIISVMIFLDDVNEFNGPLFFIPGSHQIGCLDAPKADDAPEGWEGNVSASLTYQVDENTVTKLANQTGLFSAVGKKGTAVWFHGNLIHASPPNISPFERRIIILTYNGVNNVPVSQSKNQRREFLNARNHEALEINS